MTRSMNLLAIIAFLSAISGWATAGELKVEIRSFPEFSPLPNAVVSGPELNLQDMGNGKWSFSFQSKNSWLAPLSISAQPTNGYDGFSMNLDIPYYWDGPARRTITAALVKDETSENGVVAFLRSLGSGPATPSDYVMIHQRASRLWKERARQLREALVAPNRDDIRIAYWLLRTRRDLVVSVLADVDPATRDAASWMKGILDDSDERARLFRRDTVPAEDAEAILKTLGARDAFVYNSIVQKLEADLAAGKENTCEKAWSLDDFFASLSFDERKNYDVSFGNSLKIKADILQCKRREVAPAGDISADLSTEGVEAVKHILAAARAALDEAKAAGLYDNTWVQLESRISELQGLLDKFLAKRTP